VKILFSVSSFGFLRNFEPALRLLAERGHDLHLVADRTDSVGGTKTLDQLKHDFPARIRDSYMPSRKDAVWKPLATQLRLSLDYWRYLDPRFDQSPSLRARGQSQAPRLASALVRPSFMRSPALLGVLRRTVRALEQAAPPSDRAEAFLRTEAPDLLLLTPLLYFGSPQVDYVRAARKLGIRTVLGVGSWDHLTTKGLIHEVPARLLVWNEFQRAEAEELHGVPRDRVTVTGAQAYDRWFAQTPTMSRAGFCRKVGLPADRPLLLYLCSSPFITPHEVPFVETWIAAVRHSSDPDLRRAAILIRPHPQNAGQWRGFDCTVHDGVRVWPPAGANPVDDEARADYFDSMYYSVAVVGVNTSALIESGIVGRPVFSVLTEQFAGQQEGTLHFQHLKTVNGGLLTTASSLDEHCAQLAGAVLRQPGAASNLKSRAFVEAFVRPHGVDQSAAERFADAIEDQARAPAPAPARHQPIGRSLLRPVLFPFALLARSAVQARSARRKESDAAPNRPRRLLFALASPEYLRYYDSTMRALVERGHEVLLAVNWLRERKQARLEGIDDDRIRVVGVIPKRTDLWTPMARAVRGTFDFVRYLHPRLADAPALRARIKRKVLPRWLWPLDGIRSLDDRRLERWYRLLGWLESSIPISPRLRQFLANQRADVVIVSPLVDAASDQVDLVRAAQAAGIPVVAGIASWDNLTNKGHIRVQPDLVTVWNEQQKAEAVSLHGVAPERVAITGAQLFDRWFGRQPSRTREEFCRTAGLPCDRPVILYTGSSVFIARSELEAPFAREWIGALRRSANPTLSDAAVLIRPHPFNCEAWETADFSDLGAVSVWPRQRYTPTSEEARSSLFDSLFYCSAVVGVNTSAMIEATILGRPVLSVLTPQFAATQEGTLHFHYLLPENGGFLRVAQSLEQHMGQLAEVLEQPELAREQAQRFVRAFIRPHGLTTPCTQILADVLQRASLIERDESRERIATRLSRVVTWPLALLLSWVSAGENGRVAVRRLVHETWNKLGRTWRIALKRLVIRPARLVVWLVLLLVRLCRRWLKRIGRMALAVPGRALRLMRQVRYQIGVRIRGEALKSADGNDGSV
jgi:hypothetical protein